MSIITKFKKFRGSNGNGKGNHKDVSEEKEMSFLEHLEELRWHLVRSFIAIVVIAIAVGINISWIFNQVILFPFNSQFPTHKVLCAIKESLCFEKLPVEMIAISPYEQFIKSITISIILGFIVAFPYVMWEIWRFVKPGLRTNEVKGMRGNVLIMSLLFFIGVSFSYFIVLPFAIQFLANFSLADIIENQWKVGNVIGMVTQVILAGGVLFEMPIIVYYLTKIGLLTPTFMVTYRRHAVVVLLVLSAIITPPDVISQVLIFFPLMLLYQISIGISRRVYKRLQAEEAASAVA